MSYLNFGWNGQVPLADELRVPLRQASVRTATHGRPISLTLWRSDGSGLQIQSKMNDIGDRTEVGVLAFVRVESALPEETIVKLSPVFDGPIRVTKLVIAELGVRAESGVVLEAADGSQVVVVSGANPYTLAIRGVVDQPHFFEPEYPIESYTAVPVK